MKGKDKHGEALVEQPIVIAMRFPLSVFVLCHAMVPLLNDFLRQQHKVQKIMLIMIKKKNRNKVNVPLKENALKLCLFKTMLMNTVVTACYKNILTVKLLISTHAQIF